MKLYQVWFSSAATHDHSFLKKLVCDDNTIYVFDKGYNDYKAFRHFSTHKTGFVTPIKDNARYDIVETNELPDELHSSILLDEIIEVDVKDALIPTIQIYMNSFNIGLSYDVNLSQLSGASQNNGGFEISLKYISLPKKDLVQDSFSNWLRKSF